MKTTALIATLLLAQHVAGQHYGRQYDDAAAEHELQWMYAHDDGGYHAHDPIVHHYEQHRPGYVEYDEVVYDVPYDDYDDYEMDEEEYLRHLHQAHLEHEYAAAHYDNAAMWQHQELLRHLEHEHEHPVGLVKRDPLGTKIKPARVASSFPKPVRPPGAGKPQKQLGKPSSKKPSEHAAAPIPPKKGLSSGAKVGLGVAAVGAGGLAVKGMMGKKEEAEAAPAAKRWFDDDDEYEKRGLDPSKINGRNRRTPPPKPQPLKYAVPKTKKRG